MKRVTEKKVREKFNRYVKAHLPAFWHYTPMTPVWRCPFCKNILPVQGGTRGIPDKIGCLPVTITQEMVGKKFGLFVGIELKAQNASAYQGGQAERLDEIQKAGGLALTLIGVGDETSFNKKKCEISTPRLSFGAVVYYLKHLISEV